MGSRDCYTWYKKNMPCPITKQFPYYEDVEDSPKSITRDPILKESAEAVVKEPAKKPATKRTPVRVRTEKAATKRTPVRVRTEKEAAVTKQKLGITALVQDLIGESWGYDEFAYAANKIQIPAEIREVYSWPQIHQNTTQQPGTWKVPLEMQLNAHLQKTPLVKVSASAANVQRGVLTDIIAASDAKLGISPLELAHLSESVSANVYGTQLLGLEEYLSNLFSTQKSATGINTMTANITQTLKNLGRFKSDLPAAEEFMYNFEKQYPNIQKQPYFELGPEPKTKPKIPQHVKPRPRPIKQFPRNKPYAAPKYRSAPAIPVKPKEYWQLARDQEAEKEWGKHLSPRLLSRHTQKKREFETHGQGGGYSYGMGDWFSSLNASI